MSAEIPTLSTLVKRLEVATLKLEEFAKASAAAAALKKTSTADQSLAQASNPPTKRSLRDDHKGSVRTNSPAIAAFVDLMDGQLKKFMTLSDSIGGVVRQQAVHVEAAFQNQKQFLEVTAQCAKPDDDSAGFNQLISPMRESLRQVANFKDLNRGSALFNHLVTVSEGIPALAWIVNVGTPGPYAKDMHDCAQFYANRVMKEHKETGKEHVEWARCFQKLLEDLVKYIQRWYPTGVTWNSDGKHVEMYLSERASDEATSGATGTGAPVPPPPPPPTAVLSQPSSKDGGAGDMQAVFSQLNVGEGITTGLRKVDKSQMTHKNPALRASSVVRASNVPKTTTGPTAASTKKDPKLALEGAKWTVEYFDRKTDLIIEETQLRHTVYVYSCDGCVLQVKGKINSAVIDSCKKTAVVLDSTVASVEVVNSQSCQIQVLNRSPIVMIDKTDGMQLYLSKESLDTEVLTAKSSEVNILVPEEGEDGETDFKEHVVPEQFRTTVVNGALVTVPVEHGG